jgi:tRNA(fMet)-specific endonuclease VapC
MGRVVLDTSVLIAIERGQLQGGEIFKPENKYFLPELAVAEFLVGKELTTSQRHKANRLKFLRDFESLCSPLDFDREHAHNLAKLIAQTKLLGRPRGSLDLAIAASAMTLDAVLYTRDARGRFNQLIGLNVKEF